MAQYVQTHSTPACNMHSMGGLPQVVCLNLQVPRSEMQAALALRFGGDGIVKMKGLPFKATADDVIKWVVQRYVSAVVLQVLVAGDEDYT